MHVYRNREDDRRTRSELHYCSACDGWYGVPHDRSHCQEGGGPGWKPETCACRVCCEFVGRPIEGPFGFFTSAQRWQP